MVKKIICIVQARMNSKRLPGKVLMKLNKNYSVIQFLIQRLKKCKKINEIIVACTNSSKDKKIINSLKKYKILFFKGSEKNVLNRFYKAAIKYHADIIIRITSDCPFSDPKLIDKFLQIFLKSKYDYFSNTLPRTFPDGFDIEIFNFKTLDLTERKCKTSYDKEHVTPFMRRNKSIKKGNYTLNKNLSKLRITLDNKNDLVVMRNIAKNLNPKKYFSWKKILPQLKYQYK
jgi:spore coat polysaccharide biosynthesis protein SpsF (cytidylyltransferase family)